MQMSRRWSSNRLDSRVLRIPRALLSVQVAWHALTIVLITACTHQPRDPQLRSPSPAPRAIVVSFDSFNERRVVGNVAASRIPAIRALFAGGSCAASAQPAFPSVTAAGHAAIWTGAYGDVNGIAANTHLRLPASRFTILETTNGFNVGGLRAEPIWITVAAAGRTVFAHHVTQAPAAPGYPSDDGEPADSFQAARTRAIEALALPRLSALNGYNRALLEPRVVTRRDMQLTDAAPWRGLTPGRSEQTMEFQLPLSGDSLVRGRALHVLLRLWPVGDSAQMYAAFERDLARAVRVSPIAEERSPLRGRPLARAFSDPLVLDLPDRRRASMRLRLFAMGARDTSFTLFVPGMQLAEANRASLTAAYDAAAPGWVGNSAVALWESGALGRTMLEGGDGTAEWRWLESAELTTRASMEGAAWGWRFLDPALMLDYFSLGDNADHALWGVLNPQRPGYDPALATRVVAVRERLWELVDVRLAGLMQLTRESPGTRLFVTGDHGMRATWRRFHPNAALRAAGLLALDSAGRIDLARTRAASANGFWISVNRSSRRAGIVPAHEEGAVMDEVRRVLLAVRDERGMPVVTQVFDRREARAAHFGIGGPAGGDVYYEVADGFGWTREAGGPVYDDAHHAVGAHGFPSTAADMHTVSCEWSPTVSGVRRDRIATLTEVAPAVKGWLGVVAR